MFDWNDEELTNIIWGDGGESDDHIVPYPDQIEEKPPILYGKESNHQTSTIISPLQLKKHTAKPESDDSTRASASNDKSTSPKISSLPDEMAQLDKDSGIFENPAEDREDGDFVDYGWANIGSFDDLDRIFSNNDPIFGDLSVDNADELWPSSKDLTSSHIDSNPLSADSSDLPIGAFRNSVKQSEIKDVQASIDTVENSGGKSDLLLKEKSCVMGEKIKTCNEQINDGTGTILNDFRNKGNRKKKLAKGEEASKKSESKAWAKPYQQFNSPITHQQIPLYGSNMMNQYLSSQFHPLERKNHEQGDLLPAMTPKEKIEKLRRRQQMRAIMAIQKQQLHFKNQASQHSKVVAAVENYHSVFENYSVEESVLYRLQDHISKMDMRIRLCIRDSLYRLAQSAMWRQYPNEMSSTSSRDELGSNKDLNGHERFSRMPDVETDTNPIDRTVAHLLFHQPIEFSGKPAEPPESKPPTAIFPQGDESQNDLCFVTSKNAMNSENTDVVEMNVEKSSK
ncbi:hypothetical protein STAS_04343 [Striga asiatica]|uniref:Uncharacterized protein n=1 Tax=Striga asiatica TaxID=4170 RepID=A0A5A7P6M0_STRAF|nr:hypothetical protein STAS_04343 [Striga asiatica]